MTEDKLEAAIVNRLKALTQLETCSPFTRGFLSLIGSLVVQSRDAANIGGVFCDCLDLELWYHTRMAVVGADEDRARSEIASLNEKRDISLRAIAEQLESLPRREGVAGAARHLLLAECYHHLNLREETIHELRAALELGCDRPIVCFALGYNLFNFAVERYTAYLRGLDGLMITDRSAFIAQCEEAIAALERGLADSSFDAQVHWWIGRILESMTRHEEAASAYRRAERHDPRNFRAAVSRKLQDLDVEPEPADPEDALLPEYDAAPEDYVPEEPLDIDEARRFADLIRKAARLTRMLASDDFADLSGEETG